MTPITKTTYIDNFKADIPETVEIGVNGKKAFIQWTTGKVINRDGIKKLEKYQAYKMAYKIAIDMFKNVPKEIEQKIRYNNMLQYQ